MAYHELRAPLGLMVTAARDLAERADDDGTRNRCEAIVRAADRMLRTVSQVFVLAGAGSSGVSSGLVQADTVVVSLASDLRDLGVAVNTANACKGHDHRISGDREVLEVPLQSIVSNATDHGAEGCAVSIEARCDGKSYLVRVSNPIGSKKRHQGLGVGLYLCGQLAESQGWDICIESDDSAFAVILAAPLA